MLSGPVTSNLQPAMVAGLPSEKASTTPAQPLAPAAPDAVLGSMDTPLLPSETAAAAPSYTLLHPIGIAESAGGEPKASDAQHHRPVQACAGKANGFSSCAVVNRAYPAAATQLSGCEGSDQAPLLGQAPPEQIQQAPVQEQAVHRMNNEAFLGSPEEVLETFATHLGPTEQPMASQQQVQASVYPFRQP